jgi:hypothetical protein
MPPARNTSSSEHFARGERSACSREVPADDLAVLRPSVADARRRAYSSKPYAVTQQARPTARTFECLSKTPPLQRSHESALHSLPALRSSARHHADGLSHHGQADLAESRIEFASTSGFCRSETAKHPRASLGAETLGATARICLVCLVCLVCAVA